MFFFCPSFVGYVLSVPRLLLSFGSVRFVAQVMVYFAFMHALLEREIARDLMLGRLRNWAVRLGLSTK